MTTMTNHLDNATDKSVPHVLRFLSPVAVAKGDFNRWVETLINEPIIAVKVSQALMSIDEHDLKHVDENAFACMSDCIIRSVGLGKGLLQATLLLMPESFSRISLKKWRIEKVLDQASPTVLDGILIGALKRERSYLALDVCDVIKHQQGVRHVGSVLARMDAQSRDNNTVIWKPYQEQIVASLCGDKAYVTAIEYAQDRKDLHDCVFDAVIKDLNITLGERSWPLLLKSMFDSTRSKSSMDELVDKHKSAAHLAINQVLNMKAEDVIRYVNTDDLRIMAFKIGKEDVIDKMEGYVAKGEALTHSLGL